MFTKLIWQGAQINYLSVWFIEEHFKVWSNIARLVKMKRSFGLVT